MAPQDLVVLDRTFPARMRPDLQHAFLKELMRRTVQFLLERNGGRRATLADVDAALEEMLFAGGSLNRTLLGAPLDARAPG